MAIAAVFGALGDANRLKMVQLLGNKNHTVDELKTGLGISQSSTSQHLKVLLKVGLVDFTKQGNFRVYSLKRNELQKAMQFFNNLWDDGLARMKSNLEGK